MSEAGRDTEGEPEEEKEEEQEEKEEGASRCAAFPGKKRNTDKGAGQEVPTS